MSIYRFFMYLGLLAIIVAILGAVGSVFGLLYNIPILNKSGDIALLGANGLVIIICGYAILDVFKEKPIVFPKWLIVALFVSLIWSAFSFFNDAFHLDLVDWLVSLKTG